MPHKFRSCCLALFLLLSTAALLAQSVTVTQFASGLNNPRGLQFGPDGNLYVAEGGTGGNLFTTAQDCQQVPSPVGPYTGGFNSRISKIDAQGNRTTVVDGLPSSITSPMTPGFVSGVAAIAFIGNTLYGIEAGAGCSHGLKGTVNSVFRVNADGTTTMVANLSAFQQTHPTAVIEPEDFEPDGTWYSMIAVRGGLYAVEPNHGELDLITTDGKIKRVADISATQGHFVPTALAYHGNFYVGNLHTFPIEVGSSKVLKINPAGQVQVVATGLTTVLGLAFDNRDRMYVLETAVGPPIPLPGFGKLLRIDPDGSQHDILDNLAVPTALTFGPDGALYISNAGFAAPPGAGEILKVELGN